MKNITPQEWEALLTTDANATVIDVRTPGEWAEGILENAMLLNIMEQQAFIDTVKSLDNSKNYYIYCRSGARSAQACQFMQSIGFKTTYNLSGGIMSWNGITVTP